MDKTAAKLGLVSCLILLLELALIRYMSCEIPAVGFFKNLVLIAAFLGVGVGLNMRLRVRTAVLAFVLASLLPHVLLFELRQQGIDQTAFGGDHNEAVLVPGQYWLGLTLVCLTFVTTFAPMAFLGQLLQRYFDLFSSRPLTA